MSHFLSTWNSRVFEFGAILFIASIFPGTLLPASLYALVRAASAICFAPAVGHYIDTGNRLAVVRFSIVVQRAAVAVSCLCFWALATNSLIIPRVQSMILVLLVFLACVEKLCSIMNLVAVERDWVVVIAGPNNPGLKILNSQMRRIDLFCKLAGPLAIALIEGVSTTMAILVTLGLNVSSVIVEYYGIAKVYRMVPALHEPRSHVLSSDTPERNQPVASVVRRTFVHLSSWFRLNYEALSSYICHPVFLPSIALSLLYFTVLNFSGQMVTYLLSVGYSATHIALIRTISVAFEISATWLAPLAMNRVGPIRAGLWFISWQGICVTGTVTFFWRAQPLVAASGLVAGVITSRVGLWGFDLCAQMVIQEGVESDFRGSFSSLEASFQNAFELCSYALTIIFARPDQFRYPVSMSSVVVLVAGGLYALFVRKRRGHLLHLSACMPLEHPTVAVPRPRNVETTPHYPQNTKPELARAHMRRPLQHVMERASMHCVRG
ncbi:Ferroporti-1 [Gautieria morchelliformis]|nr:Ferroporti-1 [Gautieria morchelliformis]